MYKIYKHKESNETIIINNPNLENIMEREGFELVEEVEKLPEKKGK